MLQKSYIFLDKSEIVFHVSKLLFESLQRVGMSEITSKRVE